MDDREFQGRLQRIETLIQEIEHFPDPDARAGTRELLQAVLDLHGAGLERLLQQVRAAPSGTAAIDELGRDPLVGGLLLLHGLHPLDLETRVRQALDQVRPALRTHGGSVELLSVADGVVRLRLMGNCHGCPSSAVTLQSTIEEAICARAPDVTGIEVEQEAGNGPPLEDRHSRMALPLVQG
jgi:Fe-S cluster biogenesis protein NfuA